MYCIGVNFSIGMVSLFTGCQLRLFIMVAHCCAVFVMGQGELKLT